MTPRFLLAALALGALTPLASAQTGTAPTTIFNIPALPPGASAPEGTAPATPAPGIPTPVPGATSLPTPGVGTAGPLLAAPHSVALRGPTTVRAGEATLWSFVLTNTGTAPLRLQHGACDVRFEVLSAAGAVVRPDPQNAICTLQLVTTDAAPGETAEVQKVRWDGRDGAGQPLPAGTYTLRAVFRGAGVTTAPATLNVTLR
ncbi:hypothetical protein [Deinococcus petrolearius]|uniref:FlgD Ig-like domain-containing protein n=1 Tax=Deinococcus petrolearius TaxID=1751295 RepID=A0ABW1DG14_9DEIO